jgi:hypothetical protein
MLPIVFGLLMVLGCLFLSTCVTVLTFTVVDMRRTGVAMANRLETLGQRNYEVMVSNNDIIRRVESKLDRLMGQVMTPDPDSGPDEEP